MCSIIGALLYNVQTLDALHRVNTLLNTIMQASSERGRDGYGFSVIEDDYTHATCDINHPFEDSTFFEAPFRHGVMLANFRAEPTTEYVKKKIYLDQQPYCLDEWTIVHNGTIANDKELRTYAYPTTIDSAAIVEQLCNNDGQVRDVIDSLEGSFAILITNKFDKGILHVACNYRPIWYIKTEDGYFFASSEKYFPASHFPKMIEPYTYNVFTQSAVTHERLLPHSNGKALVVCSGGLDSVVAANKMIHDGYNVSLVHFQYGSRAQKPERIAVSRIADYLGVYLNFIRMNIYDPKDSPLLQHDAKVAGGEEGAEFAHEWVPARNLVMLSMAVAYAEANDFNIVALGNNLEEAGAYPDNEPEFINRFNTLLPFAVADGKQVKIEMPVGNLMKHEIVKLGLELDAPLHLTWSCYRAGDKHCGTCGPCFMRRTAFEINNTPEVIEYEN